MFNKVIFDWKRTLYDPDERVLIDGAIDLLETLINKNIPLVLIGKGGKDMNEEVSRLGVKKYFKEILFAQGDKDPEVFKAHISKKDPKKTVLIGDRVKSELMIGIELGVTTIWIKQGKFASELPETKDQEPDYTVSSLRDCLNLLKSLG